MLLGCLPPQNSMEYPVRSLQLQADAHMLLSHWTCPTIITVLVHFLAQKPVERNMPPHRNRAGFMCASVPSGTGLVTYSLAADCGLTRSRHLCWWEIRLEHLDKRQSVLDMLHVSSKVLLSIKNVMLHISGEVLPHVHIFYV
eukprot:gnl/TRDRNA2_/TRDRNA2_173578_c4_seq5.p2 gnl/TRDRNA2_/TRDRNA2_173578_c4~~gnl/TRDRNA2_/TRDRNA2_173578_c4_seq5.p2  ORF type:complete len:142 (-),score=2.99 gnl/TRDRNA2_/TRDRNA2_173578_c4_seq5:64-489(-)